MQSFITLSNMRVTLDMIMHQFDELPLYKFCLDYNSSHDTQAEDNTSHPDFYHYVARLPAHGNQQDCLGMTPLHILACSSRGHSAEIYKCMVENYPNALLIKDRWDDIPLSYALYAEASIEKIHFLFKTHRQMWGNLPFDFGDMIMTLVEYAVTSTDFLRNLIWAQRVLFPDLREIGKGF